MRRLPLHGYLKPLLPLHCKHGKGDRSLEGRKEWNTKRTCLHHLLPWTTWHSAGSAMRKRMRGARPWSPLVGALALSRYRNMHNCDIGLFLVRQFLAGDYYQWWFDVVQLFVSMHAVCSQGMCAEMVWWEGEHPLWDLPSGWCICTLFFNFLEKKNSFSALSTKCTLYFLWGGQTVVISGGKCQLGSLYFVMDCN